MTDRTDWEGESSGDSKAEGEPGFVDSAAIVYSCEEIVFLQGVNEGFIFMP
jgi:hypothetical protein